mmetsp:Transcript_41644/g.105017  ORF Transcript_41644/g.105017 Transcript_41644/m.105017 type:complete len:119 (-) Transcript_41644:633-989(-)
MVASARSRSDRRRASEGEENMADVLKSLKEKLRAEILSGNDNDVLRVRDESSCGCGLKFVLLIVSDKFDGKGLLDRQRWVNEVLQEEMKQIHALSMNTWTPKQWAAKQAQFDLTGFQE